MPTINILTNPSVVMYIEDQCIMWHLEAGMGKLGVNLLSHCKSATLQFAQKTRPDCIQYSVYIKTYYNQTTLIKIIIDFFPHTITQALKKHVLVLRVWKKTQNQCNLNTNVRNTPLVGDMLYCYKICINHGPVSCCVNNGDNFFLLFFQARKWIFL